MPRSLRDFLPDSSKQVLRVKAMDWQTVQPVESDAAVPEFARLVSLRDARAAAKRCGISVPDLFGKAFRRWYGYTPHQDEIACDYRAAMKTATVPEYVGRFLRLLMQLPA